MASNLRSRLRKRVNWVGDIKNYCKKTSLQLVRFLNENFLSIVNYCQCQSVKLYHNWSCITL